MLRDESQSQRVSKSKSEARVRSWKEVGVLEGRGLGKRIMTSDQRGGLPSTSGPLSSPTLRAFALTGRLVTWVSLEAMSTPLREAKGKGTTS